MSSSFKLETKKLALKFLKAILGRKGSFSRSFLVKTIIWSLSSILSSAERVLGDLKMFFIVWIGKIADDNEEVRLHRRLKRRFKTLDE